MGVYIKNLELPKHDDEYVIFTVYGDGGVVYGPLNRPHVRYKNRAVPVPPHGRLIDGDVAEVISFTDADAQDGDFADGVLFAADFISQMPTIIEKDGE